MKKAVYIETSIVSYLTARPSRDVRASAWQQLTHQWWNESRSAYEVFTSELRGGAHLRTGICDIKKACCIRCTRSQCNTLLTCRSIM